MKVYISGPMSGIKDFNAPAFRAAADDLRKKGYEVVSPVEADENDGIKLDGKTGTSHDGYTWGECLSRDVRIIADEQIDAIVLLPNWFTSKGARLEVFEAILLGIQVYEYRKLYGSDREGRPGTVGHLIPFPYPIVMSLLTLSITGEVENVR